MDNSIKCPVCDVSLKGENMLRHLKNQHTLSGDDLNKEYDKVKHSIKGKSRGAKSRSVQCVSCSAVITEQSLARHISSRHTNESDEQKKLIQTQTKSYVVQARNQTVQTPIPQAADVKPQELVEPSVPPAPVNANRKVDCPKCTLRVVDVRSHLKTVHSQTNDKIKTLISDEQKRRTHLKLKYKTSQILAKLDSPPEIPNQVYTGKGLVSIDKVLEFTMNIGIHIDQDCPLPIVETKPHKPVTQQPIDMELLGQFLTKPTTP